MIIDDQDSGFAIPAESDADDEHDDAEPLEMRMSKQEAASLERVTLRDRKSAAREVGC